MEKHKIFLIALTFVSLALTGCRMNNGDIGELYGIWVVTEVTVDGEIYEGWRSDGWNDTFFQFQNNICFVTRTNELYDQETQTGTWEWIEDKKLIALNFTHTDNQFPDNIPGGFLYGSPTWLLLTESRVYNFDVTWDGKRSFVWTTVNSDGQILTYTMKKTY
ncbi:MAG: hypothetical protein J1F20_02460 [Muribaculaceae bacterium]|nr:hypothetical protein [Muribaculaceae bacterium]